jgi:hypothetical protein
MAALTGCSNEPALFSEVNEMVLFVSPPEDIVFFMPEQLSLNHQAGCLADFFRLRFYVFFNGAFKKLKSGDTVIRQIQFY